MATARENNDYFENIMKKTPLQKKTAIAAEQSPAVKTSHILLRMMRAKQPISRIELAEQVGFNRSTVTDMFKPLIAAGIIIEQPGLDEAASQGRPRINLMLNDSNDFFVGVNIGVRHSQVGLAALNGEILAEEEFATPDSPKETLKQARKKIAELYREISGRTLRTIGVTVPGLTDPMRRKLVYAPHLDWHDVKIADAFEFADGNGGAVPVIVENNATAAAMYEAHLKMGGANSGLENNFIVVRSGTGIGVGLILDGEVYRGSGRDRGIAGEFGHMTIVAGGKPCVCGNRGCWEKYASAASAASLYTGDRPVRGESAPRFVEIVSKAENGEIRARKTLEKIGEYLGIGIANVIMGIGVSHVIVSGRLVYGWRFIEAPLKEAIEKSIVGKLPGWRIECGEPKGSTLGGAIEVAVEEFLAQGLLM